MGLASSQARLLNLTSRMHDIEYKAQKLEAQKLQMANESTQVYQEYENALNKTKVQVKQIGTDGSANFIDATFNTLIEAGYKIAYQGLTQVTEISTVEEFMAMSSTGNYRLTADLDFSGKPYSPKAFSGKLDGNGHTIKGLTTSLFTSLNGATVKNLSISSNINNTSNSNCGVLANTATGSTTVENVSVSGKITSNVEEASIGGLIGYSSGAVVLDGITSTVSITDSSKCAYDLGGILGYGSGVSISNSKYNGTIIHSDTNADIGGIAGEITNSSKIENCSASGSIDEGLYCGGIVGYSFSSVINTCKSTMEIKDGDYSGGIAGAAYGATTINNSFVDTSNIEGSTVGGIVGDASGSTIKNYYSPLIYDIGDNSDSTISGTNTKAAVQNLCTASGANMSSLAYMETPHVGHENDAEWLAEMINSGYIILSKPEANTGEYYEVNIATDTALQEVSDETLLKKAEAKYEADMRKINQKDKKFDTDLASMDAERNAIKTEIDTLKSVAKENVDRTFKLFG